MAILALDIGGTAIKSGLLNPDGTFLFFDECSSKAKEGGPLLMRRVCKIISRYGEYDRIGISVTGQVDTANGRIVFANDNVPDFTGTSIRDMLTGLFHTPVAVENDVNAAALGEAFYGAGKGYNDFLCLTYGTGIGGAIVINHGIYHGTDGVAGEFGHIITHPSGKKCACGFLGCYEQYASTTALVQNAAGIDPSCVNGRMVFDKFRSGDDAIKSVIDNWIDEIVLGLITLTHVFNPKCIVLGGGIMNEPYVQKETSNRLHSRIMKSYQNVTIKNALLGNRAGLLGAMHLALSLQ